MDNSGIQLRVSDLVYGIKKRWKMIVAFMILGAILGAIGSGIFYFRGTMSRNYRIQASAAFITKNANKQFAKSTDTPEYDDVRMSVDMMETVKYVLTSERLMKETLNTMRLVGVKPSDIKNNLEIVQQGESPVVEITLKWRSADEGKKILTSLLASSSKVLQTVLGTGEMSVIDTPESTRIAGGGLNAPLWGITLLLGLFFALGIIIMEILLRPTIINIRDIQTEFGLETMGTIEDDPEYFNSKEEMYDSKQRTYQNFSSSTYILKNRLGKKGKIFFVTSSMRKEGRTSIVANIGIQLSKMEKKVLLIDFDMRNPTLGDKFMENVEYDNSLNALYRGEATAVEVVNSVDGYIDVLPAVLEHNFIPLDSVLFDMVSGTFDNYDYIIIDAPPVGEISEALSLNQIADTALLVIGYDSTTKQEIRNTIDMLDKSGTSIVGCIVNRDKSIESGSKKKKESKREKKARESIGYEEKLENIASETPKSQEFMQEMFGKGREKTSDEEMMRNLMELGFDDSKAPDIHDVSEEEADRAMKEIILEVEDAES